LRRVAWYIAPLLVLATGCVTTGGATQRTVIRAKDRVAPALVHIRPVKQVFAQGKREEILVLGSGFIISPDGYVVTNEHVVGEASFVECVLSNKEEVEAEVVGADRYTDLAVLKLASDDPLPFVKLGSSSALESGQTVLALGSPHGLARSVSLGIVSVTDRYLEEQDDVVSPYNNWIQTDAAINRGNSGGPLVNLKGEVVGVNARMLVGAENVGFAIPIDTARDVVDQIIKQGRVSRSWVGVTVQEMRRKTNDPSVRGVIIADIEPLSPAQEAGLKPGDIILSIAGTLTNARFEEDLPAIRKLVADIPVGSEAVFRVARGDEEIDVAVTTEERSDLKGDELEFEEWGFTASELTPEMVRRAQLPGRTGVAVSGVQVGGIAFKAGLQQGDIVLKMDDAVADNLAGFRRLYEERIASSQRLVMMVVQRGAVSRFVLIKQTSEDEADVEMEQEGEGENSHVE